MVRSVAWGLADLLCGTVSCAGWAAAGRISSVGGAPRPSLGRLGRPVGKVARRSGGKCYSPPAAASPFPGVEASDRCRAFHPPRQWGCGRAPRAPGVTVNLGGLSSVRPDRVTLLSRKSHERAPEVRGDVGDPPDPS